MHNIHLFGKFRQLAEKKGATDNSIINVDYVEGEIISDLLKRIGINPNEIGELFLNFTVAELDTTIPHDDSRISIFPVGMHLLCGGQHLKGHGFIEKKSNSDNEYWT